MKSKTMVWFSSTLIGAIVALALLITHMGEIDTALPFILYGGGGLAALYVLHNVLHKMRTKQLDRATAQALLAKVESEKWAVEQRVLTEQESAQTKEQNHLQIELEKIRLDQMRAQLEHERLMMAAQYNASQVTLNEGQTLVKIDQTTGAYLPYQAPARIAAPSLARVNGQSEAHDDLVIPTAPKFLDMCHMITPERAPLCFGIDGPIYGTVLDLLSMAVSGKPGRGKTTALMYYVAFLLKCGAEVWILDPHGSMNALASLNGQVLKNMPATAKVVYLDREQDMVNAVPVLMNELNVRDEYYRPAHEVKHPLLVLADELPVLAEFDVDIVSDWKADKDKETSKPFTFARLFKKFVLQARKWNCYFIGSGQTFSAETLPRDISDNLNSRIVFFSSDARARMSGLENDAIKTLLPVIRRAGPGVMVFDCSRFDEPVIGAIPELSVADLMVYLGVTIVESGTSSTGQFIDYSAQSHYNAPPSMNMPDVPANRRFTDSLQDRSEMAVNADESVVPTFGYTVPDTDPALEVLGPDDKHFTPDQAEEFKRRYRKNPRAIKDILRDMNAGEGLSNRYSKHASFLVKELGEVK